MQHNAQTANLPQCLVRSQWWQGRLEVQQEQEQEQELHPVEVPLPQVLVHDPDLCLEYPEIRLCNAKKFKQRKMRQVTSKF